MKIFGGRNQKVKKTHKLLLLATTTHLQEFDSVSNLFIFLFQYSLLFSINDKTNKKGTLKTTHFIVPQGNGENGARYLDPKYSRWLSTDPALGEYVPQAPVNDEAKKHNENLPGMGGLFNSVNLSLYHYAGNNPEEYTDPDGCFIFMFGYTGNADCGTGVAENFGVFVCTDFKDYFSVGHYSTSSTGGVAGITVSGGIEITIAPNADEFSDIEGFSILAGGSGGLFGLVSIGAEVGFNPTAKTSIEKLQSLTVSISFTAGIPTGCPGEGHIYTNYTKKVDEIVLGKRDMINKVQDDLCHFFMMKDYTGARDYINNLLEALHD